MNVLILMAQACTGPISDEPLGPAVAAFAQVVPSAGLPAEVVPQPANNNLDVEWFDGRLFLAFRTAETHFAGPEVEMFIVSTTDEVTWRFEGRVALATDVREPQLVVRDGELSLYFAVLGTSSIAFEPQGTRRIRYRSPGDWSEPEEAFESTFIPWRIKEIGGDLSLTGYTGGENVYEPDGEPILVHWLRSTDGETWEGFVPETQVVLSGGGSETDLVVRDDGSVVAVVRNEAGDEDGFGSKVCRAPAGAPAVWECAADPRKYDSPLVFEHHGRVWLVARRNLTEDGHYDLGLDSLDRAEQYLQYQAAYWNEPKRCSLWEVDSDALEVRWVLDLPSKGDTCFPEMVRQPQTGALVLYNYSSDPGGPELSWLQGQLGPTFIHRMELVLP